MIAATVNVLDLIGLRWVAGGRMVEGRCPLGGIDCWGVVIEIRRRAGLWTPDPWGVGPAPIEIHPEGLPESFLRHLQPLAHPAPYCAMKMRSAWAGGHAAVYLPDETVMQTHRIAGVVRQPLGRIQRNLIACYEFVGGSA